MKAIRLKITKEEWKLENGDEMTDDANEQKQEFEKMEASRDDIAI